MATVALRAVNIRLISGLMVELVPCRGIMGRIACGWCALQNSSYDVTTDGVYKDLGVRWRWGS